MITLMWRLENWSIPGKAVAVTIVAGYALFFLHAIFDADGFLIIDNANLLFHEGGHFLLAFLGPIGGTVGELIFPISTLIVFIRPHELAGATFGLFWIGEDLRYIGRYISDARAHILPLAGTGDHDWYAILGDLGLLRSDTLIGGTLGLLGWLIMLTAVLLIILFSMTRTNTALD